MLQPLIISLLLLLLILSAVLPTRAGAFEIAYVLEPFEPIADTSLQSNLLQELDVGTLTAADNDGNSSTGSVNISLTTDSGKDALFGNQALNITFKDTNNWYLESRLENGTATFMCHGAKELSIWYHVKQFERGVSIKHWKIILFLEAERSGSGSNSSGEDLQSWEYQVPQNISTGNETDWQEIRAPIHDFFRRSSNGNNGQDDDDGIHLMDLNRLKGWRMVWETTSTSTLSGGGTLLLDQFSLIGGGDLLGGALWGLNSWEQAQHENVWQAIYHRSNISELLTDATLKGDDGSLGIDYTIEQQETWGGFFQFNHVPPSRAYYNLSQAQAISFQYHTTIPASVLGRAHLRLILLDTSDCIEACGPRGKELENYYSFHSVLDTRQRGRVAVELYYDKTGNAFVWDGWFGVTGNSHLDKEYVKGFKFEFSMDSQGDIGSTVSGSVTISNITALETYGGNLLMAGGGGNSDGRSVCTAQPDLRFKDFRNTFRRIEFQSQAECCQVCKEDPTCYYAVINGRDCYIKDDTLAPSDVELRNDKLLHPNHFVFIKETTETTGGDYCDRCNCNEQTKTIDCKGKDLVFSPISFKEQASWSPEVLDLRNNSRLIILSSSALQDLPYLKELKLPTNLAFIPPSMAQNNTTKIERVTFESSSEETTSNALNAVSSPSQRFGDICCGKGESLDNGSGLTFCNLIEDEPGIDAVYENFVQYHQAHTLNFLVPSSGFMFEAAESPQKCAQYCQLDSDCKYFQYDARITVSEHSCALFSNQGTPSRVCCDNEHYADSELTKPGWVAGYVPRTRNEVDNARVIVKPSLPKMEATESNGYQVTYVVRLGASPLRGAVWVEPRVATAVGMTLDFSPPLVVLYDNKTEAEVTVTVSNPAESIKGGAVVISHVVEACDAAFLTSNSCSASDDLAMYLAVVTPFLASTGSSTDTAIVAVVASLALLLLAAISLWVFTDFKRRRLADTIWKIPKEEIQFDDPPKVLARGRFGNVLLAEWRGTVVAVKRVIPPESSTPENPDKSSCEKQRNEAFDKSYSVMLSNRGHSIGAPDMVEPAESLGEDDPEVGTIASGSDIDRVSGCSVVSEDDRSRKSRKRSNRRASHILGSLRRRNPADSLTSSIESSRKKFWEHTFQTKIDSYSSLQASFIQEMRQLSKLRHPCVISMMGAVMQQNEEPFLVMEYMEFGSLKDLMQNQTLEIDNEQILPILQDITQGLRFLHASQPPVIHGDLKASNILVDSRLRAKVADFGLSQSKTKRLGATGTPYWMAPELLRGESTNTAQSDSFAFGVMLYELYAKADPYEGEDFFEVLDAIIDYRVKKRPSVPDHCHESIQRMMRNCFEDNPSLRPTFEQMDIQLRELKLDCGNSSAEEDGKLEEVPETNIEHADSSDTEGNTPGKREMQLLEEVFPPHVASALREGRKVEPQTREMATILFMDVVDFTRISSGLSPIQVSNMLHRLYTKIDALSQAFEVFKVETIGDSWMGVTNLTKEQPDHVKRIADFAAAAMRAASTTYIDEEQQELGTMKLRGGFHSGPVVANVVGSRNPRYCLFGDTVNTASRMESHSECGKIQCSDISATLLEQQDPGRLLLPRGLTHVKGKGLMMTFWVD